MMNRTPSLEVVRQRFVGAALPGQIVDTELNGTACPDCIESSVDQVSDELKALFAQRQATKNASWPVQPVSGIIVQILPRAGDTDPDSPIEPLAILLDREVAPGRWRGWLVGRDVGYATAHDLVLGPEEEPRDPQCQVIQVWNVALVDKIFVGRRLGRLSDEKMAAVMSMENDLAANWMPGDITDTRMGVLLARNLRDGTGVVTGTPVSGPTDPRNAYGDIYRHAAEWVGRQMPAHIQAVTTPASRWFGIATIGRWSLAATVILVIGIGAMFLLYMGSPGESANDGARYIAGHGIQQLIVERPADTAEFIENRLRSMGVTPEIRHEVGGGIVIQADLSGLTDAARTALFGDVRVPQPEDKMLSLLLLKRE